MIACKACLPPAAANVYRKMLFILGITTPFGVAQHRGEDSVFCKHAIPLELEETL